MSVALWSFADGEAPARRLADALDLPWRPVSLRHFPDGESLVRIEPGECDVAVFYRSLNEPNAKVVELLLAASALRDAGARKVVLVAPYLAYMRQDMAFHPGEAVSQKVIGQLIAAHFDALVTVDPHLHRTSRLEDVIPGIPCLSVSATPAFIEALREGLPAQSILVGPDGESLQWVSRLAQGLGLECLVGSKVRNGDRDVRIELPGAQRVAGRHAVLVDDMISSGGTLMHCAALLRNAGASGIEAIATHCLASPDDIVRMKNHGISEIRASDSISGDVATIPLASILASAINALLNSVPR